MTKRIICPQCRHAFGEQECEADDGNDDVQPTLGIRLPESDDSLTRQARRDRTSPLAKMVRWTVSGLALLTACLIMWSAFKSEEPPIDDTIVVENTPSSYTAQRSRNSRKPSRGNQTGAVNSQTIDAVEESVVKIESVGPNGAKSLGTGFVIDSRGLIATNYHVIAEATEAQVRFNDNVVFEVVGYAAVDPSSDLAILQLRDPPTNVKALKLLADGNPPRLSEVVALGHPRGVAFSLFSGKVSQTVETQKLPEHSQQFLRQHMQAEKNHRWIQHTAVISPGNSGGPLVNRRGEVLGINTWVDRQARFSYALHVSHLAQLQGQLLQQPAPLLRYASRTARLADNLRRLSPQRVKDLYNQAKAMRWQPQNLSDYETLQQLAWAVTYPKVSDRLSSNLYGNEKRREEILRATDEIQVAIEKEKWGDFGQITLVNELASQQIDRPLAGAFFFGTVERIVEDHDGRRAMLMRLAGFEKMIFVSLDGVLSSPAPQTHCLVLGINRDGRTVQWGENPLKLSTATVIISNTIVPLGK